MFNGNKYIKLYGSYIPEIDVSLFHLMEPPVVGHIWGEPQHETKIQPLPCVYEVEHPDTGCRLHKHCLTCPEPISRCPAWTSIEQRRFSYVH